MGPFYVAQSFVYSICLLLDDVHNIRDDEGRTNDNGGQTTTGKFPTGWSWPASSNCESWAQVNMDIRLKWGQADILSYASWSLSDSLSIGQLNFSPILDPDTKKP